MLETSEREGELREEYQWAIDIIRDHFSRGLQHLTDPVLLQRRVREVQGREDPVYAALLAGMDDVALSTTFVSYWTIAQTLATQSRFWLEDAVADILIHRARQEGRADVQIYSLPMLSNGWFEGRLTVQELGEKRREELTSRRAWRVPIQRSALDAIDRIVGQQERERVEQRDRWVSRSWDSWQNKEALARDRSHLHVVAEALKGPPPDSVTLQCNLLVIEPDQLDRRPHAWGFRLINPKTIASHATRKQERVNLLRLYAFLVQEKLFRHPRQIRVCVAELVPRFSGFESLDHYPDYFSATTYWSSDRFWRFIGVPFDAVSLAIRDAGQKFREQLIQALRSLLPNTPGH